MAKKSDSEKEVKTSLAPEGEAKGIFNWYKSDAKRKLSIRLPRIPMPGFLKFKIPLPKPVKRAGAYIKNSFAELKNVTWPNRRLSINYTVSVIVFSLVFSLLLTGVDWVFTELVKKMLL
jgi:preprotein translocase subunit SecE